MDLNLLNNIYLIVGLISILMILDYWLTLSNQKIFNKYGRKHLQVESIELNPMFQKSIKEGKYNLKHLILLFFIIFGLLFLFYANELNLNFLGFDLRFFYDFFVGYLIFIFVSVISGHIHNMYYLKFINKHPNVIEGKIKREMSLQYYMGMLNFFSISIILLFILVFNPTIFIFGGLIGTIQSGIGLYELSQKAMKT